jgi:hypothetical protein
MHLILTGATGLVGSGVLDVMLRQQSVTKISILSRRPVPQADDARDPRVNVIIHRDFEHYDPALLEKLRDASGCVWALGISQTQVTGDEYVKITRDYALAAARAFAAIPRGDGGDGKPEAPFRFVYVSGEGATQDPGRFSAIFARTKGETESKLGELTRELAGKLQADSVRPAFVDRQGHGAAEKYAPQPSAVIKALEVALAYPIRWVVKSGHSPTEPLGRFLTQMAMNQLDDKLEGPGAFKLGPSWVVRNTGIRRVVGL